MRDLNENIANIFIDVNDYELKNDVFSVFDVVRGPFKVNRDFLNLLESNKLPLVATRLEIFN